MINKLKGTGVALVTPLNSDYTIDYSSLKKIIDHAIDGNISYFVVQGTTGESPVFLWKEKLNILQFVVDYINGRRPIVFGLGGNNTFELIKKSNDLKAFDLAAILSVCPYYSKPSQKGIMQHFQLLADAFPHPLILYNVPSRTASTIEVETVLQLAKHKNIIAIKEASGHLNHCKKTLANRPKDFMFLSGDDSLALEIIKMGGEGVISVIANILPLKFTSIINDALAGDFEKAKILNASLKNIYDLLVIEGNPSSLKVGLEAMDLCNRTVKPPLFDGSDSLLNEWENELSKV